MAQRRLQAEPLLQSTAGQRCAVRGAARPCSAPYQRMSHLAPGRTTYYRQQVWDTAEQYCQQAGAGEATGGRNGTQVAAYSTSPPAEGR